jgi:hypothetical protein
MAEHKIIALVCSIVAVTIGVAGCDGDSGPRKSMSEVGAQLDAQSDAAQQQEQAKLEAERKAQEAQAASQPTEKPRQKAGRADIGEGGYLTAVAGARRHILNESESWAWMQAVDSFKATNGRLPKDNEEFMKEIVQGLEVNLGYKEEGQEFFYDPKEGPRGTVYVVEVETATTPQP